MFQPLFVSPLEAKGDAEQERTREPRGPFCHLNAIRVRQLEQEVRLGLYPGAIAAIRYFVRPVEMLEKFLHENRPEAPLLSLTSKNSLAKGEQRCV